MRYLRMPLTVFLGLLVAFDGVIAYRLWRLGGLPLKHAVGEYVEPGVVRLVVQPISFTFFDWVCLGLLVALHVGVFFLVRRSWKASGVR